MFVSTNLIRSVHTELSPTFDWIWVCYRWRHNRIFSEVTTLNRIWLDVRYFVDHLRIWAHAWSGEYNRHHGAPKHLLPLTLQCVSQRSHLISFSKTSVDTHTLCALFLIQVRAWLANRFLTFYCTTFLSSGVQQGVRNTRKNKMIITSRFGFVSGVPWWNTTIKWLSCFSIAYSNCGAIQCWSNIYLIHQKFTQRFSFGMKMHVCYVRLWIDCCYVLVWFFLWQLINHYVRYYISFMPAVSLTSLDIAVDTNLVSGVLSPLRREWRVEIRPWVRAWVDTCNVRANTAPHALLMLNVLNIFLRLDVCTLLMQMNVMLGSCCWYLVHERERLLV